MQIVIEIDEENYEKNQYGRCPVTVMRKAIRNGTPLPKGHGKIIDVNDLLDDIGLEDCDENRDCNMGEIITLENIDRIPTIIEADGGDSE